LRIKSPVGRNEGRFSAAAALGGMHFPRRLRRRELAVLVPIVASSRFDDSLVPSMMLYPYRSRIRQTYRPMTAWSFDGETTAQNIALVSNHFEFGGFCNGILKPGRCAETLSLPEAWRRK